MSHRVSEIKAALAARLAAVADFGGRVFVDRQRPYSDVDLPCLEIVFEGADPDRSREQYLTWRARLALQVRVKAAESARPDTTAEGLLHQVQALLYADLTLAGQLEDEIEFTGIRTEANAAGERIVGLLTLEIACAYVDTLYGEPIDSLGIVDVQIDLASPRNDPPNPTEPDGQIDAAAIINLPQ